MISREVSLRLERLEREAARLRREIAQRPIIVKSAVPSTEEFLLIDEGNLLSDSTTQGIKYVAAGVDTVPSLYDPDVTSSFIDGIGRATLIRNHAPISGYVLVVNDGRSGSLVDRALFQGDRVFALGTARIPLASDSTQSVTVYIPYFL